MFLIATGVLHTLVAVTMGWKIYLEIFRDGVFDAVDGDYAREFALWFLVCGILLIFWGQSMHAGIKKTQSPAPRTVGWSLLIFAIVGCILEPVSGFWLFLPQALIIIFANRPDKTTLSDSSSNN
jgi:hypothetical protein